MPSCLAHRKRAGECGIGIVRADVQAQGIESFAGYFDLEAAQEEDFHNVLKLTAEMTTLPG